MHSLDIKMMVIHITPSDESCLLKRNNRCVCEENAKLSNFLNCKPSLLANGNTCVRLDVNVKNHVSVAASVLLKKKIGLSYKDDKSYIVCFCPSLPNY